MSPTFQTAALPNALLFAVSLLPVPAKAITRYIGDPSDGTLAPISQQCGGWNQTNFRVGRCPALLRCVLDNIPADYAAGLSAGSNVASLVPTIAALIGAPPLDLVQSAFISPQRAIGTCCFGVGLPSGLFRQLKPMVPRLGDRKDDEPQVREWVTLLSTSSATQWQGDWRGVVLRVVVDLFIMALTGLALWYSWKINTEVMITWRCEYGLLLILWPTACIGWLLVAIVLLLLMKNEMVIHYHDGRRQSPRRLKLLQLLILPYRTRYPSGGVDEKPELPEGLPGNPAGPKSIVPVLQASNIDPAASNPVKPVDVTLHRQTSTSSAARPSSLHSTMAILTMPRVAIRITMPHEYGFRSWRWYEAIIEALAVGVYLYATFVLTSAQFMTGEMALSYAALVTLSLSGVRLLAMLF